MFYKYLVLNFYKVENSTSEKFPLIFSLFFFYITSHVTDKNKDVIIHNCQRAGQENDGIVCLMIEVRRALHGVTFFLKYYSSKNINSKIRIHDQCKREQTLIIS